MRAIARIGVVLFAAVGACWAATQAECVQRCNTCTDGPTCDAIYATCMSTCMKGPSQPAEAPLPDVWGAIAISPSTLVEGHSWNFKSEQEASKRALKECQAGTKAGDCKVVGTVVDGCTSLAVSEPDKIYGMASRSPGVSFASGGALLHCRRAGGQSCSVVTSFCADGIRHEARDARVLRR